MKNIVSRVLLDLDQPTAWPTDLCTYLDERYELFLGWEAKQDRVPHQAFDEAIDGLARVLQPYAIVGWHCSRLTDEEIEHIGHNGMQMPDSAMLERRINALVLTNKLSFDAALQLKAENRAEEDSHSGKIWFCFYPPRRAGEGGIGRFFHLWGGEALYVCHETNPVTSAAISRIGTPCLVEAEVPMALIGRWYNPAFNIYRRFLVSRGWRTRESLDYDDFVAHQLLAEKVRRVVSFPDPEFLALTGCSEWRRPIVGA